MKKFRMRYDVKDDMFVIELWDEKEQDFVVSSGYYCMPREEGGAADYVHYKVLMTINDLLCRGYTMVPNWK